MTAEEFKSMRKQMNMTQQQMATFLCKYVRTIQSYEYGKIKVPALVEKLLKDNSFNPYIEH